jgi:hypothetical protein
MLVSDERGGEYSPFHQYSTFNPSNPSNCAMVSEIWCITPVNLEWCGPRTAVFDL